MLVYRIVHHLYSNNLNASGLKGRWNSAGKEVIYAAESIPLAFLENLVRRQGVGFNKDFKTMIIDIPASIKVATIELVDLPVGWRNFNNYAACQTLGDEWYNKAKNLVLKVPSAVLPEAYNYVINTSLPEFKR